MEEVNIPNNLEISCGYCNEYLGTMKQLMSTNVLKHHCLEKYEDVSLDVQNKKVWGLNKDTEKIQNINIENPVPGCSKGNTIESDSTTQHSNCGSKDFWTYEATKFLICTYQENQHKFESPQYNKKAVGMGNN